MESLSLNKPEKSNEKGQLRQQQNISLPVATTTRLLKCNHCYEPHLIINCDKFKSLPLQLRMDEARAKNLYTNCLRPGHFASACNSRKCLKYFRRHHTLLHINDLPMKPPEDDKVPSTSSASAHHAYSIVTSPAQVLLSTCVAKVRDARGNYHDARILLDSGSQVNFICESLANHLAVAKSNINIPVKGISQTSTNVQKMITAKVKSRVNDFEVQLNFLVLPAITAATPAFKLRTSNLVLPKNIRLADPTFYIPGKIDMLIGEITQKKS